MNDDSTDQVREAAGQRPEGILGPADRRAFLRRAGALSLAIPALGASLTACGQEPGARDQARGGGRDTVRVRNPDSKLDTSLQHHPHTPSSATPAILQAAAQTVFHRYAPELPARPSSGRLSLHWHAVEAPIRVSSDTVVAGWTFEGDIPGPVVHCRVGDEVEFTLTNDVAVPHSMDFHAAQVDPRQAFRSVPRGESITYRFTPRFAGAYLYHCGTSPVLMHLGSGMYGAIIVSPREPLPPAREFVLVQGEHYLGDPVNGIRPYDYRKMLSTLPDFVTFNGRPDQYGHEPIKVRRGDRVRFWVVNAGPTHGCAFHVVGEQFDTVYLGAPPGSAIHGVQTFSVPAGGGMCFELVCDIAGEFPFVNHAFGHGQKGAIGYLVVEG